MMLSDFEDFVFIITLSFFLFQIFDYAFIAKDLKKAVKIMEKELKNNKEKYINDFLDRNIEHFDKFFIDGMEE